MKIFSYLPQKISCPLAPLRDLRSYHSVFSLALAFLSMSPIPRSFHQVGINFIIFMDGCHISLLFPTDSVIFIHSFPFMSRQESHLQLVMVSSSPAGPLLFFSSYTFRLSHSTAWSSSKLPKALGMKSRLLIIAQKVLQALAPAFLSDCVLCYSHPLFPLLERHGPSLCALDKPSSLCFWPFVLLFCVSLPLHMTGWLLPLLSENPPGPPD